MFFNFCKQYRFPDVFIRSTKFSIREIYIGMHTLSANLLYKHCSMIMKQRAEEEKARAALIEEVELSLEDTMLLEAEQSADASALILDDIEEPKLASSIKDILKKLIRKGSRFLVLV